MFKRDRLAILAGLVFALLPGAPASADVPPVAARCVGCHNESGVSDDPDIPNLAGASEFYLANQLEVFAARARPCVIDALDDAIDKCAVIGALTDAQKKRLVAYFAGKPFAPFEQEFDAELARHGEAIHAERCERCHTRSGRDPLDDAGLLAGQPIAYLVRQLESFTDGTRWQPDSMAPQTRDLDASQIRALAHFYARAGLQRQ